MQLKIVVLFAIFAIACVQGDKECLEEKETTCTMMVTFLLLDDDPSVGVCWKLRNHIECMNDAADECQEDLDPKIKEGLKNLEEYLGENCTNISERAIDETVECETTDDDLTECIFDFLANTLEFIVEQREQKTGYKVNEIEFRCSMYIAVTACAVEKTEKKCGKKAAEDLLEQIIDEAEVNESCEIIGRKKK